jgi:hypothetical protein
MGKGVGIRAREKRKHNTKNTLIVSNKQDTKPSQTNR